MFRAHVLIISRSKLYYTASGIITPIGGRLVHMCSKHVEAYNKLIIKQKFCASSWLITEMDGQQNVKISCINFSTISSVKTIMNILVV